MNGLKNKAAIVTGGTRGIGFAIVQRLLTEGVRVLFTGRNPETGKKALAQLSCGDANAVFLAGDMSREAFCQETVRTALRCFGRLDFLVNNAFAFTAKGLNGTRQDWLHIMEAGPIAYAAMMQQFVIQRDPSAPGAIVNMSSTASKIALPERWTYNAAKGAVVQLSKCAAMDLAPNIRVNVVSPGIVWTDEVKNSKDASGNPIGKDDPFFREMHLIRRVIEPEEIAASVVFMLSDEASAITGTDLFVDGGYLAMGPEATPVPNYTGSD